MKRASLLAAVGSLCLAWAGQAVAQTAISADGVMESTSGGFKFPDGTVQTTAAAPGLALVEDSGQSGCFGAPCGGTGQDGELQAGVDWPTPRFEDNGDGTVTDKLTGLIWLKDANCFGIRVWSDALADANGLMAGLCSLTDGSVPTDWRLANVKELASLIDFGESSPPLPASHPFLDVQTNAFYWSSTTNITSAAGAWTINMQLGQVDTADKNLLGIYVWPVRGGQ